MNEITHKSLRRFNLIMGTVHFFQAVLMLMLSLTWENIREFRPQIVSNFLTFNPDLGESGALVTETTNLFTLPFGILVSLFLFLSAFAHFTISVPNKTNAIYNEDLDKGVNQFRWYEYALSSSLMIVLIATLFGVFDIGALILIFVVNATMNLFGLLMEKINEKKEDVSWLPFIYGTIAGLAPWIVIVLYAFGNSDPAEVPWFVYAIVGSYFVFFNLFPINMILQYKRVGKWRNYLYGERGYIILSLAAKTVLAWLVLFGVMQP